MALRIFPPFSVPYHPWLTGIFTLHEWLIFMVNVVNTDGMGVERCSFMLEKIIQLEKGGFRGSLVFFVD